MCQATCQNHIFMPSTEMYPEYCWTPLVVSQMPEFLVILWPEHSAAVIRRPVWAWLRAEMHRPGNPTIATNKSVKICMVKGWMLVNTFSVSCLQKHFRKPTVSLYYIFVRLRCFWAPKVEEFWSAQCPQMGMECWNFLEVISAIWPGLDSVSQCSIRCRRRWEKAGKGPFCALESHPRILSLFRRVHLFLCKDLGIKWKFGPRFSARP